MKRFTGTKIYKGRRGKGTKPTGERARRLRASGFEPRDVGPEQAQFILKQGITGKKTMFGGYKVQGPAKKENPQKYMKRQDKQITNRLRTFDENTVWRKDRDYKLLSEKKIRGNLTEREQVYYNQLDSWFKGEGRKKQLIREDKVLSFFSKAKQGIRDRLEKRREAAKRRDELAKINAEVRAEEKRIRKAQEKQQIEAVRESVPGFRTAERKVGDISQKINRARDARRKRAERTKNVKKMEDTPEPAVVGKYVYKL